MGDQKTYREASKMDFKVPGEGYSVDEVNTGSFMRIADSLEIIAKDKETLEKQIAMSNKNAAYWQKAFYEKQDQLKTMTKSRNAYKALYYTITAAQKIISSFK